MTNEPILLAIIETEQGQPDALAYETLGLARRLADESGGRVTACMFGTVSDKAARDVIAHGAHSVYLIEGATVGEYQADAWLPDLLAISTRMSPSVIMAAHSSVGADLLPRLAFRLDSAVVTACIHAQWNGDELQLTRTCYGGKAREVVSVTTRPVLLTAKAKCFESLAMRENAEGTITRLRTVADPASLRTKIRERHRAQTEGMTLESARVIVAGGGGMKGPEGFQVAETLARVLGGAVGASRLACDLGWCPPSYQIGLSGKTVAPELYVAVGISGAGQHMAGCANAKTIVAINTDRNAPIFKFARYGVVADCRELMPTLIAQLEARRA